MTPYYQDEWATIYHGDCRDVLPHVRAVDLVLTDPPYGISDRAKQTEDDRIGKRRGGSNTWHADSDWDIEFPADIASAIGRLGCPVAWFGHWRKRSIAEKSIGLPIRAEIVWAKDCHTGPPCPAAPQDERLWLFSDQGIKPLRFETTVWIVPIIPTWAHRYHKNEKPLGLITRAISWLPGDVVLDPCMGSGTTLRAAKDLGRKSIGIEIEEKYCEIAAKRLAQGVLWEADTA